MLKLSEINHFLNGKTNKDVEFNKIKVNSNEIEQGDLFLAINKGHDYINEAINNGAVAIISEKEIEYPSIKVDDSVIALGKIAHYIRNFYNIPLIAITGSVGKTTTKELIYLVLSKKYKVLKSNKNQNNHIGLPLTLLNLDNTYDVAVTELGMNHLGEISYLSKMCNPNYGIITNIGSAHIGNLGSKRNILKAKLELKDGLNGILIVNKNDKYLKKTKKTIKVNEKELKVKNIKYGLIQEFDIGNVHFIFNSYKHLLDDVFLAIKVGLIFNIDLKLISQAISEYQGIEGRLNVIKGKYTVIDDSYNSSFESLIGGLKVLKNIKQFKYIILGDMLELGNFSIKYHKKINKYLKKLKNKKILLIGNYTKYINGIHFNCIEDIKDYLSKNKLDNCLIYIKGSRAMNLDKINDVI